MIVSITGEPKITIRVHDADLHSEPSIEIARLRARVAELEAALKPFALQSDKLHSGFDDGILAGDTPLANVFVCDLRRASAVLKKENEK